MVSKREWKRRYNAGLTLAVDRRGERISDLIRERDQAIAERDRARDIAVALENEVALLEEGVAILRAMPGRWNLIGDEDFDALVGGVT